VATGSTLRRDIISAYVVTIARVLAWIIVTAIVYRVAGRTAFALLGLVQSTVGILEYAAIGLSPAIISMTAQAIQSNGDLPAGSSLPHDDHLLRAIRTPAVQSVYASGFAMAMLTSLSGAVFLVLFLSSFRHSHTNMESGGVAVELMFLVGIGTLLRMASDAPGATLQTCGRIFIDNLLLTSHEIVWMAGTALGILVWHLPWQRATGFALVAGSLGVLAFRSIFSHYYESGVFNQWWKRVKWNLSLRLLGFGGMVVAAQMADYLYAPTNNILITRLIGWKTVGDYTPAVQIDGGMLLLVSALATVLLPRTALAHAAGNIETVRRYYIRGTLATGAILLFAAPILVLAAPFLFTQWLGGPLPATCAILPFVLIHTVIGGSSAVGRSILLAIGKVRVFTASVIIGGVANVVLSYTFVRYGKMGLLGIVFGTIFAVTARCAIWLPWYTLRVLRKQSISAPAPLLETIPPPPIP
jgi:O-antigen/teichoic acid export membrane protein